MDLGHFCAVHVHDATNARAVNSLLDEHLAEAKRHRRRPQRRRRFDRPSVTRQTHRDDGRRALGKLSHHIADAKFSEEIVKVFALRKYPFAEERVTHFQARVGLLLDDDLLGLFFLFIHSPIWSVLAGTSSY